MVGVLTSRVYDVCTETPLTAAPRLSKWGGCQVLIKREDLNAIHSFKLRGCYNKCVSLSPEQLNKGITCFSAGNHAQAVAFCANKLKCKAKIFMPAAAAQIKVDAVKYFGKNNVEVVLTGMILLCFFKSMKNEDSF